MLISGSRIKFITEKTNVLLETKLIWWEFYLNHWAFGYVDEKINSAVPPDVLPLGRRLLWIIHSFI